VHVAVLSVAPWLEYRDEMQPAFKEMTPQHALDMALPSTMAIQESLQDSLKFTLKGGLSPTQSISSTPGNATSNQSTALQDTGKKAGADVQGSVGTQTAKTPETAGAGKTTQGGSHATASEQTSKRGDTSENPSGSNQSNAAQSLCVDPLLKYLAATALYQEVQLLNRYIKDAAIDPNYSPYLVRLQVSLMPRMMDEPFDAYLTISFFPGEFEVPAKSKASANNRIRVLPILVTDDIEAAIHNHSLDQVRQFAVTLSAAIHRIQAGADVQKMTDQLQSVLGRDLNSTFTVARLSDNTIRCRFGAQYQSNSKYAMIPQTHNVTLVLLIPDGEQGEGPQSEATGERETDKLFKVKERTIHLVSKATLTNIWNGKNLQARSHSETLAQTRECIAVPDADDQKLDRINECILRNDWEGFKSECEGGKINPLYPREYLWVNLEDVHVASSFSSTSFVVYPHPHKDLIWDKQTPIVIDDGLSSTVSLRSGAGIKNPKLAATLTIGDRVLPHSDLNVKNYGKVLEIKFPSLVAFKLAQKDKPPDKPVSLCVIDPQRVEWDFPVFEKPCFYVYASADSKEDSKSQNGSKSKKGSQVKSVP